MKRRWIAMALCGAMLAGVLSGCGGNDGGSAEGGDTAGREVYVVSGEGRDGTGPAWWQRVPWGC